MVDTVFMLTRIFYPSWNKIVNIIVAGLINTSILQTFEKWSYWRQTRQNDKDKRVNSKGQDLFGESITIKIGPFRDEDVVWIGVRDCPVVGPKIHLLVAEAGWSETQLSLTWDVLMWARCVVLVRTVDARKLWWCGSPLLGEVGAGLRLVLLLVGAGLTVGLSWSRSVCVGYWKVQELLPSEDGAGLQMLVA